VFNTLLTYRVLFALLLVVWLSPFVPAQTPPPSYGSAKALLANLHTEIDHQYTLYCRCAYTRTTESGGNINQETCSTSGKIINWEHVVPASRFGQPRACWALKDLAYPVQCAGEQNGRDCCQDSNPHFGRADADPNNLFPSVDTINHARHNHAFGAVAGEARDYGACNVELSATADGLQTFEPPEGAVRGTLARAMLYMAEVYGADLRLPLNEIWDWHIQNPPEAWEIERARLIAEHTGLRNRWILGP